MNQDLAKKYANQKSGAKKRGIEWGFTYETWLEFWGADIEKRGQGHDKLCMQRFGDKGAYTPDNVRKGYPRGNAKTAGVIRRGINAAEPSRVKQTKDDWAFVHSAFFPKDGK